MSAVQEQEKAATLADSECCPYLAISPEQKSHMVTFRAAFSHLETPGKSICAWLTDEQQEALSKYRTLHGLVEKSPWDHTQLPTNTTPEEVQQVEVFKKKLDDEGKIQTDRDKEYCTDLRLLQYLRARDHHLDKSYAMLLHSLEWRSKHKPWECENVSSRTNKKSSDSRILGYDKQGRVVVYSSFANTNERTVKDVQINAVATMEKAAHCQHAGGAGSVVWVNHFGAHHKNGFGWRDCNPAFCWSGIDVFSNNYPECLHVMMIVDPPSIFFNLWAVLKPLLPEKTQHKGDFIDSRKDNTQHFIDLFGGDLAQVLLQLIAQDAK